MTNIYNEGAPTFASGLASSTLTAFFDYSAAIWKELARQSRWDCCVADSGSLAA